MAHTPTTLSVSHVLRKFQYKYGPSVRIPVGDTQRGGLACVAVASVDMTQTLGRMATNPRVHILLNQLDMVASRSRLVPNSCPSLAFLERDTPAVANRDRFDAAVAF